MMVLLKLTVAIGKDCSIVLCSRFDWLQEVDQLRLRKSLDKYSA